MAERLGELLVKAGQITKEQLREALTKQKEEGGRLGSNLVKMGLIQEPELVEFLSKHFKVSAINLSRVEIDEAVVKIIPADVARKYTIMPVSKAGAKVTIAMLDPTNVFAMDDIKFMTGYNVEPVIASETAIRSAIEKYYGSTHALELKKVMED
ncbi:MAG: type II secretion system protein GspE, partial [bacterium]|nr:type II secretion system protein GspE [bacterium]